MPDARFSHFKLTVGTDDEYEILLLFMYKGIYVSFSLVFVTAQLLYQEAVADVPLLQF